MYLLLVVIFILVLVSGMADGFNQAYLFHFSSVQKRFPNLKPNEDSWKNKYKKGDPKQGVKFFGSTTFLVWLTDIHHLTRTINRWSSLLALVLLAPFFLNIFSIQTLIYILSYYIIWTSGFHIIYTFYFK